MFFDDLYIGSPPGMLYPDLTEILNLRTTLDMAEIILNSPIGLNLESDLDSEITFNARIYS